MGLAKEWWVAIRPPCVKGAVSRRLTGGLFLYTNHVNSVDNLSLKSTNDPSVTLRVTAPLAQGSLVKGASTSLNTF